MDQNDTAVVLYVDNGFLLLGDAGAQDFSNPTKQNVVRGFQLKEQEVAIFLKFDFGPVRVKYSEHPWPWPGNWSRVLKCAMLLPSGVLSMCSVAPEYVAVASGLAKRGTLWIAIQLHDGNDQFGGEADVRVHMTNEESDGARYVVLNDPGVKE